MLHDLSCGTCAMCEFFASFNLTSYCCSCVCQFSIFLTRSSRDQLSSPPTSVFTGPSVMEFHPAWSVKYRENIVTEVNISQLDALLKSNTVKWQQQCFWLFFSEVPLFRIIYFSSDFFISNARFLFLFLSVDTVQ